MDMARSSCNGNAIRYVLPVLWMTSCFHMMEKICLNQRWCVCLVEIARWRHRGRSLPSPTAYCSSRVTAWISEH